MKVSEKSQSKKNIKVDIITVPGVEQNSNPANEVVNETIVKIVEKKQIKIGDEFIIKGSAGNKAKGLKKINAGNFDNVESIFVCAGVNGDTNKVTSFKKFESGILQDSTNKNQRFIFEVSEIKAFKSLVLLTESQNKLLDKIDEFDKETAKELEKLRHIANVSKVENMGLCKALKTFLANGKGVLSPKTLKQLEFKTVLEYIKTSRYRYNQFYTFAQIVQICNDVLKENSFIVKQQTKVSKQGGFVGVQADKFTKISNKKAA